VGRADHVIDIAERCRVGLDHVDRRMHGAGIGNAHAALQLQRLSPLVEGRDALGVVVAMADHQRQMIRGPGTPGAPQALAQDPLRGQMREPQRQNSLLFPQKRAHLGSTPV